MIDSSGTVGFDLEKNRAAIDSAINSLLCEGWDNEASTVRRLVAEIERLRVDAERSQLIIDSCHEDSNCKSDTVDELDSYLEQCKIVIDQQVARIGELEAQLTITNVALENATRKPNVVYITGTGEIGADDSPKMAIWQITEERKTAIDRGLQFLEWSYAKNSALDTKEQIAVLWAMLDEVGQCE